MMKLSELVSMRKIREALSVKPETEEKIKIGIGGLIGGAVIAMVIGFNLGGWTTSSATQKISEAAVLKSQAAICVAQIMKEPNNKAKMEELQKLSSYDRPEYIAKKGWDKMPGQKEASTGVSNACAEGLQPVLSMK
ncbi:MAG: hypothetical protein HY742_03385 [Deltaproteobacteria bacterium]|nr:hypothetical protein [Deltaproteobacteria bacterium]